MNNKPLIKQKIYYLNMRNILDTQNVTVNYWLTCLETFENCLKNDFPTIVGLSFIEGLASSLINSRIISDIDMLKREEEISKRKKKLEILLEEIEARREELEYSSEDLVSTYNNISIDNEKSK